MLILRAGIKVLFYKAVEEIIKGDRKICAIPLTTLKVSF